MAEETPSNLLASQKFMSLESLYYFWRKISPMIAIKVTEHEIIIEPSDWQDTQESQGQVEKQILNLPDKGLTNAETITLTHPNTNFASAKLMGECGILIKEHTNNTVILHSLYNRPTETITVKVVILWQKY